MPYRWPLLITPHPAAPWRGVATCLLLAFALATSTANAQISYFNIDSDRPTKIEDALPLDRYLLDLHLSPVGAAIPGDGATSWRAVAGATYGIVPRTQVSLALPLAYHDDEPGIAGIDVGALYTLTAETRTWPALAVRGDVRMSVGPLAPERTYGSLKGIVTRRLGWARLNVNGGYTFGSAHAEDIVRRLPDVRRWLVGGSLDRSFATRSLLAGVEVYALQPLDDAADVAWHAGVGLRYQLTTHLVLDAGVGAPLTDGDRPVTITVGLSRAQALKALIPGLGRWGW